MSNYTCFLVTLFYTSSQKLMKCALRIHNDHIKLRGMKNTSCCQLKDQEFIKEIEKFLPLHVKSCGPIIEVERIFECTIINKEDKIKNES